MVAALLGKNARADVRVWLLLGLALGLGARLMAEYLWVLSLLPLLLWVVAGVALLIVHAFRMPRLHEVYSRRSNVLGIVAGIVVYVAAAYVGGLGVEWIRFRWNRSEDDRIAAAVAAGTQIQSRLQFTVDAGPPARVAFPWPGGVIDNWCGVIYDPSAEVLRVNELTTLSQEWRAHRVTALFGGDMTSCPSVRVPYYLCCFT